MFFKTSRRPHGDLTLIMCYEAHLDKKQLCEVSVRSS
jgi:hypothetical protein